MKKIPTIYKRDPATKLRYVKNERHPDCGWVFAGEGKPTYKWDGTAIKITDEEVWCRRQVNAGADEPEGFWEEGHVDPVTGKRVGWVPVGDDYAQREALNEALAAYPAPLAAGTYELVGPKVNKNPHRRPVHELHRHGTSPLAGIGGWFGLHGEPPVEFDALGRWLHAIAEPGFEGIVWHHPDGRMAKIKAKDFPRAAEAANVGPVHPEAMS